MSDHEFEKQVKQKMDELRFTPSDAVWNKVAGELRKDRPRRRGWVLLPLLAIGLGAGGYFFYQKNLASDKNITLTANETNKTSSTESVAGNNLRAINDSAALLDNGELVNPATSTLKRSGHKDNNRSGVAADGARLKEKEVENINPSVKKTGRTSTGAEIGMKNELSAAETKTADAERKTNKTTGADSQTVNANNETTDAEKNTAATDKKVTGADSNTATIDNKNSGADKNTATTDNKNSGADSNTATTGNKNSAADGKPQGANNEGVVASNNTTDQDNKGATGFPKLPVTGNNTADSNLVMAEDKKGQSDIKNSDSLIKGGDKVLSGTDASIAPSTAISKTSTAKKRGKSLPWEWGVNASVGISGLNNGNIRDALKSSPSADAAFLPQASNNALFAPSPLGIPPARASSVKAGVQFTVGGFVKKQLNKTFAVTAGLQYSQYNNVIRVGYRVDSSRLVNNGREIRNVATYYRGDEKTRFSNTYHFIELPLILHTQLNKSVTTPLYWNAGVNFTRIIASDALLFDSGTGVYYKDDSKQNKTQIAASTGFSIGLFSKSRTPVWVGPGIRYNITSLYNDDLGSEKHLLTGSIDLRMFINKKSVQRK